ncbi:uncharacterized protein LOC119189511 [Manduca sexta]|uniref:uncharacterized protein LOC119189511 n=1 Tax=Manduca sexta TaxID=7130 RepID=UPI001890B48B|nr:uncharacterized protein LOC119189511 [Manduca sexta]
MTLPYFLQISFASCGENIRPKYIFALIDFIVWIIYIIGTPVLFVFALLYSRVRLMRQTLESNDFDCRILGKHHPRRYIQMYEAIMDGLEACDGTVKLQIFNYLDIIWFILEFITGCSPLVLAAVLADLVTMETQKMLVIALDRRIACKNERDREEIQKLFLFLKRNPFQYSLGRVVPLNVRSLLSFFSFTVTTIIAILQIQSWNT